MKIGNLEVYGVIYKITNKINNKVYIGQTTQDNGFNDRYKDGGGEGIERVYNYHKSRKDNNTGYYNSHLLRSIDKYRFKSFEVCEIFDIAFSKEELNIKEAIYIKLYNSNNDKFGYNATEGGEGRKGVVVSDTTRDKLKLIAEKTKNNIFNKITSNSKQCLIHINYEEMDFIKKITNTTDKDIQKILNSKDLKKRKELLKKIDTTLFLILFFSKFDNIKNSNYLNNKLENKLFIMSDYPYKRRVNRKSQRINYINKYKNNNILNEYNFINVTNEIKDGVDIKVECYDDFNYVYYYYIQYLGLGKLKKCEICGKPILDISKSKCRKYCKYCAKNKRY